MSIDFHITLLVKKIEVIKKRINFLLGKERKKEEEKKRHSIINKKSINHLNIILWKKLLPYHYVISL